MLFFNFCGLSGFQLSEKIYFTAFLGRIAKSLPCNVKCQDRLRSSDSKNIGLTTDCVVIPERNAFKLYESFSCPRYLLFVGCEDANHS